ncbi:MAG: hypothetical protein N2578_07580, partial [Bdellovibrionaceae bacterium]|nr:hypothetical protein [Pseudobdellovibrionaceae bacterium]
VKTQFILDSQGFFDVLVEEAVSARKIKSAPLVKRYISQLLSYYLDARNLFENDIVLNGNRKVSTLAEMYLVANSSEPPVRQSILKRLGDKALYISGFFGSSLQRKVVDIEYYVQMGGAAYRDLAAMTKEDGPARVYSIISSRFVDYVDVLAFVSQKAMVQNHRNIIELYETWLRTGSLVARDRLIEMGVIPVHAEQKAKA